MDWDIFLNIFFYVLQNNNHKDKNKRERHEDE